MKTVPEGTSTTLTFADVEHGSGFDEELTRCSFRREQPEGSKPAKSKGAEKSKNASDGGG